MEDSHVIHMRPSWGFFSVLDGHGGDACSIYIAKRLHEELEAMSEPPDNEGMKQLVFRLDTEFLETQQSSGSTCTFCIVNPPTAGGGKWRLRVGNIGDSRVLLGRADGTMVEGEGTDGCLTIDHKPDNESEKERIMRTGGHVEMAAGNVPRVNGDLAVSRSFGDRAHKQTGGPSQEDHPVSAEPEFFEVEADEGDFLMLVCDGISEGQFPNREVIQLAAAKLRETPNDPADACACVCHEAIKCNSKDNLSCMIVQFGSLPPSSGAPSELLPGPFAASPSDTGFKKAYTAMCEHAQMSMTESMEMRYTLVEERIKVLRTDPDAKGPGWMQEPLDELERELEKFGSGPPEGASKEERVAFFEEWLSKGDQEEPTPDIPGIPPSMMQLLQSRPQLLRQLAAAGGPAGLAPPGGAARQEERMATVCAPDKLRQLIEESPSLKWDDRFADLGNTKVTVQQDDDSDGTSRIHSASLGMRGWIPRQALQDYIVRVAPLEELKPAIEAHPGLKWDDRRKDMANQEGLVTQVDDSDDTAKVTFPHPVAMSAWFPMHTLEEVTPSPDVDL